MIMVILTYSFNQVLALFLYSYNLPMILESLFAAIILGK